MEQTAARLIMNSSLLRVLAQCMLGGIVAGYRPGLETSLNLLQAS